VATEATERLDWNGLARRFCREQGNIPATPKDATEATEQRELQQKLNHRNADPDAPGRHQSRNQISEETQLRPRSGRLRGHRGRGSML
jgi:hypothetical protein